MRIASLVPSSTEMLFTLGLGDQVVAVTHECDWPPAATFGSASHGSVEWSSAWTGPSMPGRARSWAAAWRESRASVAADSGGSPAVPSRRGAAYVTDNAVGPIAELIDGLTDYRNDNGANIKSAGGRAVVQHLVGEDGEMEFEWEEFEHTNLVLARWLFQREVMRRFQGALGVAPTDSPKFDARVRFGSRAHKAIQKVAEDVVKEYIENVYLKSNRSWQMRWRVWRRPCAHTSQD